MNIKAENELDTFLTSKPKGIELSDVYLRNPGNDSSDDSEGEEEPYTGIIITLNMK